MNRKGKPAGLPLSLFVSTGIEHNSFTSKLLSMNVDGKMGQAAKFLTYVVSSEGYEHHNPLIHTTLGTKKDKGGESFENTEEMENYKTFLQCVNESADARSVERGGNYLSLLEQDLGIRQELTVD